MWAAENCFKLNLHKENMDFKKLFQISISTKKIINWENRSFKWKIASC